MVTKFITKGKGSSRKVIPLRNKLDLLYKFPRIDIADKFYSMPTYILNMTDDKYERNHLSLLHQDKQLLNHLRLVKDRLIGHIGKDTYIAWVKLKHDIDDRYFDVDAYLRSKGIRPSFFEVSYDDQFKSVLKAQGVEDKFIDNFLYMGGKHYRFVGVDGQSYDINFKFHLLDKEHIMSEMAPVFKKHLGHLDIDKIFKVYNNRMVSEKRRNTIASIMKKRYHEVHKGMKRYIKE